MKVLKIFGPPGTGKTTRLLELFERELMVTPPERIAFLTFTRAAKNEALTRSGKTQGDLPYLRTLHAACYRQLAVQPNQMVKKKGLKYFGKLIGMPIEGANQGEDEMEAYNPMRHAADLLLHLNHLGRHRQVNLQEALRDVSLDINFGQARQFTLAYRAWKTAESMLDYTDILTEYLARGEPLPIDVLFSDESQDMSRLQWEVLHKLGANAQRWYLAGDDDQAIFSWAGASPEQFIQEPADEVEVLSQSYRLPQEILRVSQRVVRRIQHREVKRFTGREDPGEVREVGFVEPRLFTETASCFLLFRNHHRGRLLSQQLEEQGIPFRGSHSILEAPGVAAAVAGWRAALRREEISVPQARALRDLSDPRFLLAHHQDLSQQSTVALTQIYKEPPADQEWSLVLSKIPRLEHLTRAIRESGWEETLNPRTTVMSIHQSKGREADRVILDTVLARKTFDSMERDPDSEHRVFYVAVTRARRQLWTLPPEDSLVYQL